MLKSAGSMSRHVSALFEYFAEHVKCVVLNACYSENQGEAKKAIQLIVQQNQVRNPTDATVAMTG